jgi:hypothetical protein
LIILIIFILYKRENENGQNNQNKIKGNIDRYFYIHIVRIILRITQLRLLPRGTGISRSPCRHGVLLLRGTRSTQIELNEDTLPPDNPPNKKMHPDPKFATGGVSRTIPLSASSASEQKNPMPAGRPGNSSSTRQQPQLGDSKNDANDMYVKIPIYIAFYFVLIILTIFIFTFI